MKKAFLIFTFISITTFCFAGNYYADFAKAYHAKDTLKQIEVLSKWEKESPEDPELFTSYFNYYYTLSRQEVLTLTTEQPQGESLALVDSGKQTAGYIGNGIYVDKEIFQKGLDKIALGIKLHPNRLDMRFGKIYVLGENSEWKLFTQEIIKAIQYSATNKNAWTWTNNEKREEGKNFFLSSLQDYQLTLYNTQNDSLLNYMQQIAKEILKIYPTHIESLSNLSVTYLLSDEYQKAIDILLEAEKLNPKDAVVLANIAQGYYLLKDSENAIIYYKKMMKYAPKEDVEFAKERIKELKK